MYYEKHLRVDLANRADSVLDYKRTVFIGSLPFDVEEESLWEFFSDLEKEIECVRVVRDKATNVGKGIAYVPTLLCIICLKFLWLSFFVMDLSASPPVCA